MLFIDYISVLITLLLEHSLTFCVDRPAIANSLFSNMAAATPRVKVVGHSFVSRLQSYIRATPSTSFNLNLRPDQCSVLYSARPGGTVDTFRNEQFPEICRSSPEVVVMQIGSNDLCNLSLSTQQIIYSIQSLIADLYSVANVRKVVFMQILFRHQPRNPRRRRRNFDVDAYNARVNVVNLSMITFLQSHPYAIFGKHLGLYSYGHLEAALSDDGTHLNNSVGYRKYFNNVRKALLVALRQL